MEHVEKVVITGSEGFLGRHLRTRLVASGHGSVVGLPRSRFSNDSLVKDALAGADAVVHLAGVNRGEPSVVQEANQSLARTLIDALGASGETPRLLFANSVHAGEDTPYGRGKEQASAILAEWADGVGAPYVDMVLPNLFGENGRPDYNSFVATFCHRLATGASPRIDVDRAIELLHAQDAAAAILEHLAPDAPTGVVRPAGAKTTVGEVLSRLEEIARIYSTGRIPDLEDTLTLRLFNTYRSYLYPGGFPLPLTTHPDSRGVFVETTQCLGGQSQSSFSVTRPGVTRGNHFHLRKVERFVVVRGRARIAMRPVWGTDVLDFAVSGNEPAIVDMPTLYTHNITNVGDDELWTLFWINEVYDPSDPDTFPQPV